MGETTKSALLCPDLRGGFHPRISDLKDEDRRTLPMKLRCVPRSIGRAIRSDVLGHASVRASTAEVAALRRSPGNLAGSPLPPSRLKHADDQTVVGLAAVLRAIEEGALDPTGFGDWGVLAASRFLGRATFNAVFPQFLVEGAWGVSPHLVANHSLHSVSGMVSQVLKAQGANLGVGGGPGGEIEALLMAASFLDSGTVPGVWIVLTGSSNPAAHAEIDTEFEALALALGPPRAHWNGFRLSVRPGTVVVEPPPGGTGHEVFRVGSTLWRVDRGMTPSRLSHVATRPSAESTMRERVDDDGERS
jgi:hypothetical protein